MIDIRNHESRRRIVLPQLEAIPIKAVRTEVETAIERYGALTDARRAVQAADNALSAAKAAAETGARAAASTGSAVPAKDLRRAIRDAEDDLEESRLTHRACATAFDHAQAAVAEAVGVHRERWAVAAERDAEKAIAGLATARAKLLKAKAEALAAFGVLGMLDTYDTQPTPILRAPGVGSPLAVAVNATADAIAAASQAVEAISARRKARIAAAPALAAAAAEAAALEAAAAEAAAAEAAAKVIDIEVEPDDEDDDEDDEDDDEDDDDADE
ncbi:hypothetical protein [Agrococcus beijingensis]|uniref:hypothetical protein n=1 Tax=Agrococcus beijingensis TaxID=3068634 RepID=UPI002740999B|nr:hypothetical protein [Agrococcus sp. REN33]